VLPELHAAAIKAKTRPTPATMVSDDRFHGYDDGLPASESTGK